MNGILTRPARTTRTGPAQTGTCDGGIVQPLAPRAGWLEDEEQRDTDLGPMPDETDTRHHQLVERLVAEGDHCAWAGGRRARRTLAEMAPGYTRQPVLILHRPQMANTCPLCDQSPCRPMCPFRATPVSGPAALATGSARKAS